MNLLAHVAGVPFEEALLSLSSVGAALAAARGWVTLQRSSRRQDEARGDEHGGGDAVDA